MRRPDGRDPEVRNLCQRTVVLHNGEIRHDGDTEEAISLYHRLLAEDRELDEPVGREAVHSADRDFDLRAQIERFDLLGPDGSPTRHLASSDEAVFVVEARFLAPVEGPLFGVSVVSGSGVQVYGEATGWEDGKAYRPGDLLRAKIRLRMCLASGTYSCSVGLATKEGVPIAAQAPPVLLYVTGRNEVNGLADLEARFELAVDEPAGPPSRAS
jgi:hypothetical protein